MMEEMDLRATRVCQVAQGLTASQDPSETRGIQDHPGSQDRLVLRVVRVNRVFQELRVKEDSADRTASLALRVRRATEASPAPQASPESTA